MINPMNMTSSLSNRVKTRRKPFSPLEQPFDFIAFFIQLLVMLPGFCPAVFRLHDRRKAQLCGQLSRFISFICLVHDQSAWFRSRPQLRQESAAFRRIPGLARRKRKYHCAVSGGGNKMQFCCPPAAGFADRLRAIFLMPRFRQDEL
jgi:hypothetical protein